MTNNGPRYLFTPPQPDNPEWDMDVYPDGWVTRVEGDSWWAANVYLEPGQEFVPEAFAVRLEQGIIDRQDAAAKDHFAKLAKQDAAAEAAQAAAATKALEAAGLKNAAEVIAVVKGLMSGTLVVPNDDGDDKDSNGKGNDKSTSGDGD